MLALNLFVLNGASVVGRCLRPLRDVIDELVVVDCGSEDETPRILEEIAIDFRLDRYYYQRLHPYSRDFFDDSAEIFDECCEKESKLRGISCDLVSSLLGPFTRRRMCGDFARARNLALDNTTADYVLKLDADDEIVSNPDNLTKIVSLLDVLPRHGSGVNLVTAPYEVTDGHGCVVWLSMHDRLWRRQSCLRWSMPIHEHLDGKLAATTTGVESGLLVRDWRDSTGAGVRVPHRNLKTLLWGSQYRNKMNYQDVVCYDFTLGHESVRVFPEFSRTILGDVLKRLSASEIQMIADCHYHIGNSFEVEGRLDAAVGEYLLANASMVHLQALLKAYELGSDFDLPERPSRNNLAAKIRFSLPKICYNCDLRLLSRVTRSMAARS